MTHHRGFYSRIQSAGLPRGLVGLGEGRTVVAIGLKGCRGMFEVVGVAPFMSFNSQLDFLSTILLVYVKYDMIFNIAAENCGIPGCLKWSKKLDVELSFNYQQIPGCFVQLTMWSLARLQVLENL
jgi:hypothetical protein